MTRRRPGVISLAVCWVLVIGWCTLRPAPQQAAAIAALKWYCVVCGDSGIADVTLNVILFLPLGLALHAIGWPIRRTVAAGLLMSVAIEVTQGQFLPGRDACIGDVLSNTTGITLGWLSLGLTRRVARPDRTFARRATVVLLGIMAVLWIATGAALQPSLASDGPWIGQPMHDGRGAQPFPGTLQRASLNGVTIPNEAMPVAHDWRDSIVVELDATRRNDSSYSKGIVMLRVLDNERDVQLAVDQLGKDARVRLRLRGNDWMFHSLRWLVQDGMPMQQATPWQFQWRWFPDHFELRNAPVSGGTASTIEVPLSIGLGWAFVHPFVAVIGSNRTLWTACWLGFWFGLLGWLAASAGYRAAIGGSAVAALVFAAVSLLWHFALQPVEVVSGGTALLVGIALAAANARRRSLPR